MANNGTMIACGSILKGRYVLIKGRPCRIFVADTLTRKHGISKIYYAGTDVFTGELLKELSPCDHMVLAPTVTRTEYLLLNIKDDGFLTLSAQDNDTRFDIFGGDYVDAIREMFNSRKENETVFVVVISYMGQEKVDGFAKK